MYRKQELNKIRQGKESWESGPLRRKLETADERKKDFATSSGIPVKRLYTKWLSIIGLSLSRVARLRE